MLVDLTNLNLTRHQFPPVWKAHLGLAGMAAIPSSNVGLSGVESGALGCTRWTTFLICKHYVAPRCGL